MRCEIKGYSLKREKWSVCGCGCLCVGGCEDGWRVYTSIKPYLFISFHIEEVYIGLYGN